MEREQLEIKERAYQQRAQVFDDLAEIARREVGRADALEDILHEAVMCNFEPGEWQEKAIKAVT